MKILMLDTITYGDDISLDKFKTLGEVITYRTSTQEEALQRIKEIQPDVVVTNKVVITKELFEASPNINVTKLKSNKPISPQLIAPIIVKNKHIFCKVTISFLLLYSVLS